MNISICICTRKRKDGLKRLLDSFEKMQTPPDIKIRIIIVENDIENYSEYIIKEFSLKSKFRINYYLEPRQGLVFARNKSVEETGECDFCCFTDDDQIVSTDWLIELLKCQHEFNADGVAGPTYPIFDAEVPAYIKDFHTPSTYQYGTIVNSAFTGCLLIRKKYLDLIEGPFDLRLNFTGGEDSYLTYLISTIGGVIRYNPKAIAYENIPDNRTTIKYVIKRAYKRSNTGLFVKSLVGNEFSKLSALPKLTRKFCYGFLIVIPFIIFGKANKLKGLLKIIDAIGGFLFIFGRKIQFYK